MFGGIIPKTAILYFVHKKRGEKMPKENRFMIYIPDDFIKTYEEIKREAKKESHGTGVFLCKFWKEKNKKETKK